MFVAGAELRQASDCRPNLGSEDKPGAGDALAKRPIGGFVDTRVPTSLLIKEKSGYKFGIRINAEPEFDGNLLFRTENQTYLR